MSEVYLVGPAMRSGWRLRVCGLPNSYGEGEAVAVEVEASPREAVEELMERLALSPESVMLEINPDATHPVADIEPQGERKSSSRSSSPGLTPGSPAAGRRYWPRDRQDRAG